MRKLFAHRSWLGTLVAAVVLFGSAGYTLPLTYCIRNMDAMSCCDMGTMPADNNCRNDAAPSDGPALFAACTVTVIAGGVNTAPAISEKSVAPDHQLVAAVAVVPAPAAARISPLNVALHALSTASSPPPDRCILFSTYLI